MLRAEFAWRPSLIRSGVYPRKDWMKLLHWSEDVFDVSRGIEPSACEATKPPKLQLSKPSRARCEPYLLK